MASYPTLRICMMSRITMAHGIKGGMELQGYNLCQALLSRGHEVVIITTAHPNGQEFGREGGALAYYISKAPSARYSRHWWTESPKKFTELNNLQHFDIVWSQSVAGLGFIKELHSKCGVPAVAIAHGTPLGELKTRLRNLSTPKQVARCVRYMGRAMYHLAFWAKYFKAFDGLIAVSQEVARDLQWEYGLDPSQISVIPNGIDIDLFSPSEAARHSVRREYGIDASDKVLLSVGRLETEKGFHLAIEALAKLRSAGHSVRLFVIGSGSQEERLKHLARDREISANVEFCGFVPNKSVPAYLNAADVFIMPTLCHEGFPMTIVEAMACGLPVVATNIGGIPTAIDDGRNGLLFAVGNVEALTAQVGRLLEEPSPAQVLGEAARAKAVKCFSVERMVNDTEAVFQQVVAEAKRQ